MPVAPYHAERGTRGIIRCWGRYYFPNRGRHSIVGKIRIVNSCSSGRTRRAFANFMSTAFVRCFLCTCLWCFIIPSILDASLHLLEYLGALAGGRLHRKADSSSGAGLKLETFGCPRSCFSMLSGAFFSKITEAKGFGLLGEYFNNRWTFGDPVVTRVDAKVDFSWSDTETITPTGQDYISVR